MTTYDQEFFDRIRAGAVRSAAVVAPLVLELIDVRTVLDVGCGEGHWAARFAEAGCEVAGVDGGTITEPVIDDVRDVDLEQPGGFATRRYDLAVALEVAEHLSPGRAESFVHDLCDTAPAVLFSAAIPGQPGHGHVNCQWPTYWERLFSREGYVVSGSLRWRIWTDESVEPWYRQNLLLALERTSAAAAQAFARGPWLRPTVIDVVHPDIWGWLQ